MVAIKNLRGKATLFCAIAALALQTGCAPPGPRALLKGEELLRKGKPAEAIEELRRATELLPAEPRAWNYLGLAYHRAGQPLFAVQAYRNALAKDRSNTVAIAHYNLGSLWLEQNNAAAAAEEFRSYTLITNSAAGLVKLGVAQLRLRQFDAAERTFLAALRLEPRNAEALNDLGTISAQRNQRDAAQSRFNAALATNPKYSSALLNSALVAQQSPATKAIALQRYREFLSTQSRGPQSEVVKSLARQLEVELSPPMIPTAAIAVRTNALAATNTRVAMPLATNQAPQFAAMKSNPPAPAVMKTNPIVAAAVTNKPAAPAQIPVTIVAVANEVPVRIARAEIPTPLPASTAIPPAQQADPGPDPEFNTVPTDGEGKRKSGFFSRLNPFGGKSKPAANDTKLAANDTSRSIVVNPPTDTLKQTVREAETKPALPRYTYRSSIRPASGDRINASRALQQALSAQRTGKTNEALLQFQNAIAADPSYFDAQYNAALLAFQLGDLKSALAGWETALALEPDSMNARYSFALALKKANYAYDAAAELEKIIDGKPEDARAHLALANLYAQPLQDPAKARLHYLKFLSIDPRNPQAPAIRFWLAANP